MLNIKDELLKTTCFIENEYLNRYVELIESNCDQNQICFKTTAHHIIPKYCFKVIGKEIDNTSLNLVNLLYKDHILAHFFLAECSSTDVYKWYNYTAMNHIAGNKFHDVTITEALLTEEYLEELQCLKEISLLQATEHFRKYGIHEHSEETRKKMSKILTGHIYITKDGQDKMIDPSLLSRYETEGWIKGRSYVMTVEARQKLSNSKMGHDVSEETKQKIKQSRKEQAERSGEPALGHKLSEESKQKMRDKLSQQICVNNGESEKHIYPNEYDKYVDKGYKKGRLPRAWVMKDGVSTSIYAKDIDVYLSNGWQKGRGALKK